MHKNRIQFNSFCKIGKNTLSFHHCVSFLSRFQKDLLVVILLVGWLVGWKNMGFLSEARALRNAAMATIPRENGAPKIKPINPHLCDYDDEHAQITVIPLCGASSQLAAPRYVLFWPSGGVVPLINDTHDQVSQDLLSQTCAKDTAAALQTILGSLKEGAEQTSEGKVGKVETGIQVQPNSW